MARALNVTPAKARSLLFQYQLRNVSEAQTDHAVMIALTTSRYRKEGDNLAFGVASPLVKAAIMAKMQDGGVFADVSLTGDILKVDPGQFGAVISSLLSDDQAKRLVEHLKKKKVLDEGALRKAIKDTGTALAKKALETGEDAGMEAFLKAMGRLASDHGPQALDLLDDLLS